MTRVPFASLFLGCLGLLPFLYGALMLFADDGALPTFGVVESSPAGGLHLLERFGAAILAFMGGCLWGFASSGDGAPRPGLLVASIVPAFVAFVAIRPDPAFSCLWLAFGFALLQAIDVVFQRLGAAPEYWLSLRLPLTAIVIATLLTGALHG